MNELIKCGLRAKGVIVIKGWSCSIVQDLSSGLFSLRWGDVGNLHNRKSQFGQGSFFIIAIWLNHNLRGKHLRYLLIHLGRGRGDWCGFGWFLLIAGLNNLDWTDLPLCNLESLLVSTGHLQECRWSWLLRRLLGRSRATVGSLLLRRGVVGGWRWNRWWWKADWIGLVALSCESD